MINKNKKQAMKTTNKKTNDLPLDYETFVIMLTDLHNLYNQVNKIDYATQNAEEWFRELISKENDGFSAFNLQMLWEQVCFSEKEHDDKIAKEFRRTINRYARNPIANRMSYEKYLLCCFAENLARLTSGRRKKPRLDFLVPSALHFAREKIRQTLFLEHLMVKFHIEDVAECYSMLKEEAGIDIHTVTLVDLERYLRTGKPDASLCECMESTLYYMTAMLPHGIMDRRWAIFLLAFFTRLRRDMYDYYDQGERECPMVDYSAEVIACTFPELVQLSSKFGFQLCNMGSSMASQ